MATGVIANNRRTAANGRPTIVNGRLVRRRGEPTWEVVRAFPLQGHWSEDEYLAFERNSENQMVELVNGFLEFLPMPVPIHQRIVGYSYRHLHAFAEQTGEGAERMQRVDHMRQGDQAFAGKEDGRTGRTVYSCHEFLA